MEIWLKKLPKSRVELTIKTDEKDLAAAEKKVLQKATKHINIPGFRPGKVPLSFVQQRLDQDFIRHETIEYLGNDVLRKGLEQENLQVIGTPEIKIENEKSCPKFKFNFSILPKVNLGDYKKALRELKTGKRIETAKSLAEAQIKAVQGKAKQNIRAKKLGTQSPKEQQEELNEKILGTLLQIVKVEIPEVLIEHEVETHLMPAREEQIKRLGLTLENYLKIKEGKSLDKYKKELEQEAERILKLRLILQKIANVEQPQDIKGKIPLERGIDVGYIMNRLREIVDGNQ